MPGIHACFLRATSVSSYIFHIFSAIYLSLIPGLDLDGHDLLPLLGDNNIEVSTFSRVDALHSVSSNTTVDDMPHGTECASQNAVYELANADHESLLLAERLRRSEARVLQWKQAVERIETDYQASQDRVRDLESMCAAHASAAAQSVIDREQLEYDIAQYVALLSNICSLLWFVTFSILTLPNFP